MSLIRVARGEQQADTDDGPEIGRSLYEEVGRYTKTEKAGVNGLPRQNLERAQEPP